MSRILFDQFIKLRIQKYGNTIKFQTLNQIIVHTADLRAIRDILIEKVFPKDSTLYNALGYPYGVRYLDNF